MSLTERLLAGDPRALARALSLLENGDLEAEVLRRLRPHAGRAFTIGVTGAPGAGKSTLVDQLITRFRTTGARVGVLAVDPTSPYTGGALLGDRVRMQAHADDAGVFIRSMATRGQLGGLAAATAGAVVLLDASGFEIVIIETVGVGQAEVDIARTADVSIIVFAPGGGDDVQALKAGIMEIGDIFVVNKADLDGADRTSASLSAILALQAPAAESWRPVVLRTVARTGQGVREVVENIERFRQTAGMALEERRRVRAKARSCSSPQLDHVGIAVKDVTAFASLCRDLFGIEAGEAERVGPYLIQFLGTAGAPIELVQPATDDSPVAKFLANQRAGGLHHLCLRVPDLDVALSTLKARGVVLVDETPRSGAHGARIAFVHPASTGGVLIELKEHQPKD